MGGAGFDCKSRKHNMFLRCVCVPGRDGGVGEGGMRDAAVELCI